MPLTKMEFCLVRNLTMDGNQVVYGHQCLLLGVLALLLPFIPGSEYLLPTKKLISKFQI